jgi:hypothetical protein
MPAPLELVTFLRPRVPMSGAEGGVSLPETINIAGWVFGHSINSIAVAAAMTSDGPRGVTIVPTSCIVSRAVLSVDIPVRVEVPPRACSG